ncbi:hypothetical protein M3Y94_00610000 [Aphelenchoides besseyi]|nr:hypothetical protein M3Y94_00610000 [Aphelenchoides besseyi]
MESKKPQLSDTACALLIRFTADDYNAEWEVHQNFNFLQRFRIFRTFLISRRFPNILLRSVEDEKTQKPKHYKDPCLKFIIESAAIYSSRCFGLDIYLREVSIPIARILVALSDVQRLQFDFFTNLTSRQVVSEWQRLCLVLKDHRTLKAIEVNVFDSNTLSFRILLDNIFEKIVYVYAYKESTAYHLEQCSKQLEKFVFDNRNRLTVETSDFVSLLAVRARVIELKDLSFLLFSLPDAQPLKRNEVLQVLKITNDPIENFIRRFQDSEYTSKFESLMRTIRTLNDHLTLKFKLSEQLCVVENTLIWDQIDELIANARKMINSAALAHLLIQKITINLQIEDIDGRLRRKATCSITS